MIDTVIIIFSFLAIFLAVIIRFLQRNILLNKYKTILDMLDHFLQKAYQIIYNDQMIGYTAEGVTTTARDEMETIERNFIKMSFELMGPKNVSIFTSFFGDRDTLIKNMVMYFRDTLGKDEISKIIRDASKEANNL